MKTYNVGIIGFGFIGKVHAYAHRNLNYFYGQLPFRTRITRVCTGRKETAEAARDFLEADSGTVDYREICENPDVDIVHICSPNHLHRDQLLSAIAHGKHIYCDKPITGTLAEAREIEAALETYTGTGQMTFQNRFFPSAIRARQVIEEGRLGRILQFRAAFLHAGSANPEAPLKWKLSAGAGGGVIADLGSHVLDLLSSWIGPYDSVSAATTIAYPKRPSPGNPSELLPVDAEDAMWVLARMTDGSIGTVEATKLATGSEDELRIEIHGVRGGLRFNSMDPHHLDFYDAEAADTPAGGTRGWLKIDTGQRYAAPGGFPGPKLSIGWLRSHVQCLYAFLDAVHHGHPADPDLRQGIAIQRAMDAVRRSAVSGQWVKV